MGVERIMLSVLLIATLAGTSLTSLPSRLFYSRNLRAEYFSQFRKNKTHKNLILKMHSRITLPVTRVAAFETDKGIGNRCGDTRERESATVC